MKRVLTLAVTLPFLAFANSSEIPPAAGQAIAAVHKAAGIGNLSGLQALMADEFTWSFGGDSSADQAIAAWKDDPSVLAALHQVTGKDCGFISAQIVQCPLNAGVSYRAGFAKSTKSWHMIYFVAGD